MIHMGEIYLRSNKLSMSCSKRSQWNLISQPTGYIHSVIHYWLKRITNLEFFVLLYRQVTVSCKWAFMNSCSLHACLLSLRFPNRNYGSVLESSSVSFTYGYGSINSKNNFRDLFLKDKLWHIDVPVLVSSTVA